MISIDTNVLLVAYDAGRTEHPAALAFLRSLENTTDVVISEFVLVEFYRLLRNAAVVAEPLAEAEATRVINTYRSHPLWAITGFPSNSSKVHDALWRIAAKFPFASRRIFDARLALTLREFGVTEFATANVKDFQGFGFHRVWNPCL